MDVVFLLVAGGVAVGVFGSLLGLGGGLLMVPLLTLGFHLPLREAIGVSLVCIIVTSGASASVFLDRGSANLRLGMFLELFTAVGALVGGSIAVLLPERFLSGLFAVLLLYTASTMIRRRRQSAPGDEPAADSSMAGSPTTGASTARSRLADGMSGPAYRVRAPLAGAVGGVGAGTASALLGIGGGLVMVPVMHIAMGVPLRMATATSNLMVGITASTSALVYLLRGGIDAYATGPAAVGVFVGATIGSRIVHRVRVGALRLLFAAVLTYTALLMIQRAMGGG